MTSRLGSLVYHAMRLTGVTAAARRLGDGVVLCYHDVVDDGDAAAGSALGLRIPISGFARHMRWLCDHYTVVSLEEIADRAQRGGSLRRVAAVSFDDGYAGVLEHAWPLLRSMNIPATVFVIADRTEFWWDDPDVLRQHSHEREQHWLNVYRGDRAAIIGSVRDRVTATQPSPRPRNASWDALTAAARAGLTLGAHTVTHRAMPKLDDAELEHELGEGRAIIARHCGITPTLLAYPYGLWDERVRRATRSAGYRAAFTLDASKGTRLRGRDPWSLPRLNIPAGISDVAFQAWTALSASRI